MRVLKFYRAKLEIAIFKIETRFMVTFLKMKQNLNERWNALMGYQRLIEIRKELSPESMIRSERGDVPGWVLVVLMTTGLVTAIWTIAAPRLSAILRNSLDAMNGIR